MLSSEAQLQLRAQHNLLAIFTILRDAAHVGEKQSICLIDREVEIGRPLEIVPVHVVVDPESQHTRI